MSLPENLRPNNLTPEERIDLIFGADTAVPPAPPIPPVPSVPPVPPAPQAASKAAAWKTTEAPASCNLKIRAGGLELWYTARDTTDDALQARLGQLLPWLRDVARGLEAAQAQREAAPQPPAGLPQTPGELVDLLRQAAFDALQAAGLPAPAHMPPPAAAPAPAKAAKPAKARSADQEQGFCSLHQEPMELRENERGSWYSHYVTAESRYCKGAK